MAEVTRRCSRCQNARPEDQFIGNKTYRFPEGKVYKTCNACRAGKVGQRQSPPPAQQVCGPGMQRCPQCGTTKPVEEFTGVRCTPCRDAINAEHRQRVAADPEYRARKLQYTRDSNRRRGRTKASLGETLTTTCRRCLASFTYLKIGARPKTLCELCHRHRQEGLKYGLTGAEVSALRARNACDICGTTDSGGKGNLFKIDHCHETGMVRGLLCHPCNIVLGIMQDQPGRLRAAADYVEKYRAQNTGVSAHAVQPDVSQRDA